jgi:hypothetical protein
MYLKECLWNVKTHGSFWNWAYTIVFKSFYLLLQRGLAFFHWFDLLSLTFLECWALIALPLVIHF